MIRLILRLLNIRDYEGCKSCETLKQQLALVNEERERLTSTILNLVKPQVIPQQVTQTAPLVQSVSTFSRRRAELEKSERTKERIVKTSPLIAKVEDVKLSSGLDVNSVEELEKELGLEEKTNA